MSDENSDHRRCRRHRPIPPSSLPSDAKYIVEHVRNVQDRLAERFGDQNYELISAYGRLESLIRLCDHRRRKCVLDVSQGLENDKTQMQLIKEQTAIHAKLIKAPSRTERSDNTTNDEAGNTIDGPQIFDLDALEQLDDEDPVSDEQRNDNQDATVFDSVMSGTN